MESGDILGFGKASEKLIDIVSKGCGTLYRPRQIRREAAARAEEIRLLSTASAEAEAEKIRIVGLADAENKLLASQVDVEILERAKARLVTREIQRQHNIENIAQIALSELPQSVSEKPVEENWRTRFFNIAEDITDSEMQTLWGKILADEVASPGRYSLRTLDVLRNLSRREAELFQTACSLTFEGGFIAQLEEISDADDFSQLNIPSADLKDFGLTFTDVLTLRAAGLISSGDGLIHRFFAPPNFPANNKIRSAIQFNGLSLVLEFPSQEESYLPALALTPAGKELRPLVPHAPNIKYLRRLAQGLHSRNVDLYRAKITDGVADIRQREEL